MKLTRIKLWQRNGGARHRATAGLAVGLGSITVSGPDPWTEVGFFGLRHLTHHRVARSGELRIVFKNLRWIRYAFF